MCVRFSYILNFELHHDFRGEPTYMHITFIYKYIRTNASNNRTIEQTASSPPPLSRAIIRLCRRAVSDQA